MEMDFIKQKKMIRIFIDIENTVIDSLFDRNWMLSNIEGIKKCLKKLEDETLTVSLFTWGWTKTEEIEPELVKMIFDKLEVREDLRSDVVIKENSVDDAIHAGWLHSCDKEEALIPGMMNEFGLTKQMMFFKMCEKFIGGTQCILIDDLVERDSFQVERLNNGVSIALFNPKDL